MLPPARRRSRQTAAEVRLGGTGTSSATPAKIGAALLAGLLALVSVPARAAATDQAERDYKAGKYPAAEENYQDAAAKHPKRDDLKFDLGDAAYKAGEYSQAEDAFRSALETPDLGLQEKAYYNIGNAQYRQGEGVAEGRPEKDDQALGGFAQVLRVVDETAHVSRRAAQLRLREAEAGATEAAATTTTTTAAAAESTAKPAEQVVSSSNNEQRRPGPAAAKPAEPGQPKNPKPAAGRAATAERAEPAKARTASSPTRRHNGQQPSQQANGNEPKQGHSVSRAEDQVDPGTKSRQDAEALLDSLKDDEKHITARSLQGDDQPPPPPPSGKDW